MEHTYRMLYAITLYKKEEWRYPDNVDFLKTHQIILTERIYQTWTTQRYYNNPYLHWNSTVSCLMRGISLHIITKYDLRSIMEASRLNLLNTDPSLWNRFPFELLKAVRFERLVPKLIYQSCFHLGCRKPQEKVVPILRRWKEVQNKLQNHNFLGALQELRLHQALHLQVIDITFTIRVPRRKHIKQKIMLFLCKIMKQKNLFPQNSKPSRNSFQKWRRYTH